ncbi:hypothetical protein TIFTF001_038342 [Ficus carica]|uniref:Uncharacterized protein n=1 Tax=Ficus carica TaxID=3494 RepID=A0AA88E769_FICCA|nr:hypothetical protein TIFTF001_038342 [Ficus carica]
MIKRLCKLRHIYALNTEREHGEVFHSEGQGIKVVGGIKELSNLTQLKTLGIYLSVRSEDWRTLCSCVEKMKMLESLCMLNLYDLSRLRSLIIEETTLPMLEELCIGPCPEMKDLPSGLQHLKKLKNLEFDLMPLDFLRLLIEKEGGSTSGATATREDHDAMSEGATTSSTSKKAAEDHK